MGKKTKSISKSFMKFGKSNKIMLAALGGAAAGIAIAKVLGTEKAAEILKTAEKSVKDFGDRLAHGLDPTETTEPYSGS